MLPSPCQWEPLRSKSRWSGQTPGEGLQNDLDLIVSGANGSERHGNQPANATAFDRTNNVEQVVWDHPASGQVNIRVRAFRVAQFPQSYAVVVRIF